MMRDRNTRKYEAGRRSLSDRLVKLEMLKTDKNKFV